MSLLWEHFGIISRSNRVPSARVGRANGARGCSSLFAQINASSGRDRKHPAIRVPGDRIPVTIYEVGAQHFLDDLPGILVGFRAL